MNTRTYVRSLAAASAVLIATQAFGQAPIQERILGRRIAVPPISERIEVKPIEDEQGSFSAVKSGGASRIYGVVINELGVVLPSSGILLIRSVRDGRPIAQTPVDPLGQFSLRGIDPGLYTAELVNSSGAILTTSPSFTVGLGEAVQLTPVLSQSSIGGLAQILGSSTASAVNSAASAGILAVAPLPPATPGA